MLLPVISFPTSCSYCAPGGVYNWPGGCTDAHVRTCTSGPLEKQGLKAGLEGVCNVVNAFAS